MFILLSCISFFAVAEQSHFLFMNIPIEGTIVQFQSKLEDKGFLYNVRLSKESPSGARYFNGIYAEKQSEVRVDYNQKSKTVYAVQVIWGNKQNIDAAKQNLDFIVGLFRDKYPKAQIKDSVESYSAEYLITTEDGSVRCFTRLVSVSPLLYDVVVVYQDKQNYAEHLLSIKNDL